MTPRLRTQLSRALVVPLVAALVLAVQFIVTDGGGPVRAAIVARAAASAAQQSEPVVPPPAPALPAPAPLAPAPLAMAAPQPEPPRTGMARAAVDAAESVAPERTDFAVAVLDRDTGELALGKRGTEPFYTASLSKVVVAVDIVDRRRLEGLVVTPADLELLHRALSASDDGAMNALWSRFDGAGAPARVSARLGLSGTTAPSDPSQWGEMSVPAVDHVRIWQYILDAEPSTERTLLISAMQSAPATARDGFDQAFGLLAPEIRGADGTGSVAKQGWMCCFSGRYYLHSAGAVGADDRYLVALLARIPRGVGWEPARQQLDSIATAAVQALS